MKKKFGRYLSTEVMKSLIEDPPTLELGGDRMGRGQAVSIIAEAGLGKSRLLYEFRKAVINEDVTFLEGKCLSYSKDTAYHSVIDILKSNFDIRDHDRDDEIREKVKKGLAVLGVDEASTLPYLLELLSVRDSGVDHVSISPEAKKDRTHEAIKRLVLKGSEIRPLILAMDQTYQRLINGDARDLSFLEDESIHLHGT